MTKKYEIQYGANVEYDCRTEAFPSIIAAFENFKKDREESGEPLERGDEIAIVSGIAESGLRVYAFVSAGQGTNMLIDDDFDEALKNFNVWYDEDWDNPVDILEPVELSDGRILWK